jgi:AcrR family transcriptional regulator
VLDDHLEQQMGAIQAELDSGPRPVDEEVPRMRDVILERAWGDDWGGALYLEYLLYARQNPEAQEKLAAGNRRTRETVQRLIEAEYARLGVPPTMPTESLAVLSLALFEGLAMLRLVDPSAVTDETLDQALELMYAVTYPEGGPPASEHDGSG